MTDAAAVRVTGRTSATAVAAEPVRTLLDTFLSQRTSDLVRTDPSLGPIASEICALVAGSGKMLRPAFVYWGHRAARRGDDPVVWWVAAAVEMLHAFALIHDDVMDRSPLRRGRPSAHASLAGLHRRRDMAGDAEWFGISAAILAGDLAFLWAGELLDLAPLPTATLDAARNAFTELRSEVMAGQYLDLCLGGQPDAGEGDALRVALLKSGRYTVTRPLLLGATVAGGDPDVRTALTTYGDAVGLGFQVRDDVLGLYGDPAQTGKSALSDVREGKRTVLVLKAMHRGGEHARRELDAILGDPAADEAAVARVRHLVIDSGALAEVEALIAQQSDTAMAAVRDLPTDVQAALVELATSALHRRS